jgi:hypothetical protein
MRVYNYLTIILGLLLLFNMAGIETTSHSLLDKTGLLTPENFTNSTFITTLSLILAGVAVATVTIGLFTKASTESFMLAGYSSLMLLFAADIVGIMVYANSNYGGWVSSIVTLLLGGVAVGYAHSVISWWGSKA